jgi:hypothetical protein
MVKGNGGRHAIPSAKGNDLGDLKGAVYGG